MDSSLSWSHKFFSKVFGFENLEEEDDTLDQTNRSQIIKKKGIKITKLSSSFFSMVLPDTYHQQLQKKWFTVIRVPYQSIQPQQLLQLTYQGISYPNKVLPWLIQNKYKINIKLFNIKRAQYRTCQTFNQYRLQKMNSQLIIIKNKIKEPNLAQLLGMFLLFREDIQYSDILLRIAQSVEDYLYDAPLMAFSLLYYFCCMGVYLPFLTHQVEEISTIIKQICYNIHQNCSSSSFFQRDKIYLERLLVMPFIAKIRIQIKDTLLFNNQQNEFEISKQSMLGNNSWTFKNSEPRKQIKVSISAKKPWVVLGQIDILALSFFLPVICVLIYFSIISILNRFEKNLRNNESICVIRVIRQSHVK